MSLPHDVLDHILSFLQSDLGALKACSQSHPKFIQLVEWHLYTSITLYDNNTISENGLGTRQFINLLSDNPHIGNYIRSLEVSITYGNRGSLQYLEDIASVLRMCSLLNKIALKQIIFHWASLPENFRLAFLDCLRLSSMKADYKRTSLSPGSSELLQESDELGRRMISSQNPQPTLYSSIFLSRIAMDLLWKKSWSGCKPATRDHWSSRGRLVFFLDVGRLRNFLSSCSNTLTNLSIWY